MASAVRVLRPRCVFVRHGNLVAVLLSYRFVPIGQLTGLPVWLQGTVKRALQSFGGPTANLIYILSTSDTKGLRSLFTIAFSGCSAIPTRVAETCFPLEVGRVCRLRTWAQAYDLRTGQKAEGRCDKHPLASASQFSRLKSVCDPDEVGSPSGPRYQATGTQPNRGLPRFPVRPLRHMREMHGRTARILGNQNRCGVPQSPVDLVVHTYLSSGRTCNL